MNYAISARTLYYKKPKGYTLKNKTEKKYYQSTKKETSCPLFPKGANLPKVLMVQFILIPNNHNRFKFPGVSGVFMGISL